MKMANTEITRAPGLQTLDELGFDKLKPWLTTFKLVAAETVPRAEGEAAETRNAKVEAACKSKFFSYAGALSIAAIGNLPGKLLEASWPALEKGMLDYFVSAEDAPELWMAKLQKRAQEPGEGVQAYADSFLLMAQKAGVEPEAWKGAFKSGLAGPILRAMNGHRLFTEQLTFIAVVKLAKAIEVDFKPAAHEAATVAEPLPPAIQAIGAHGKSRSRRMLPKRPDRRGEKSLSASEGCEFCGKEGHTDEDCWSKHPDLAPSWWQPKKRS